jgi:hypothetical protein
MLQPKARRLASTALEVVVFIACVWLTALHVFLGAGAFVLALTAYWIARRNMTVELLAITFVILFLVGVAEWRVIYPVRVNFSFDYGGKHFETSYLTAVII